MLNRLNWTANRSNSTGEFHPVKLPQIDDKQSRVWGFMSPKSQPRNDDDRMAVMVETVRHDGRCILLSATLITPTRDGISAMLTHTADGTFRPDTIALDRRNTGNLEKLTRWCAGTGLHVAAVHADPECPPLYGTRDAARVLNRIDRVRDAARVAALAPRPAPVQDDIWL